MLNERGARARAQGLQHPRTHPVQPRCPRVDYACKNTKTLSSQARAGREAQPSEGAHRASNQASGAGAREPVRSRARGKQKASWHQALCRCNWPPGPNLTPSPSSASFTVAFTNAHLSTKLLTHQWERVCAERGKAVAVGGHGSLAAGANITSSSFSPSRTQHQVARANPGEYARTRASALVLATARDSRRL